MSKAFKCDRCKTCFDPYAVSRDGYFTTIPEFFCQNGTEYSSHEVGYRDEDIHLCAKCSKEFAKFIEEGLHESTEQDMESSINTGYLNLVSELKRINREVGELGERIRGVCASQIAKWASGSEENSKH